jgi:hypothetical protein
MATTTGHRLTFDVWENVQCLLLRNYKYD